MSINSKSTIAILGGAGKAGRSLVRETLKEGYSVRLLLRHPEQFDSMDERMEIIQGDARNPDSIRHLLEGCNALLSTIGNPKGEQTQILSRVTENILAAMPLAGISRYVVVTSLYAIEGEQQDEKTKEAAAYMQRLFPLFMADREVEYELLCKSNVDWTYVRLPYVTLEPPTGRVAAMIDYLPGQQITAEDLARFLVSQLTDRQYIRKAPFVANK